jgi:hypothetical protein
LLSAAPACLSIDIGILISLVYDAESDPAVGAEAATVRIGAATYHASLTGLRARGLEALFQAVTTKDVADHHASSV